MDGKEKRSIKIVKMVSIKNIGKFKIVVALLLMFEVTSCLNQKEFEHYQKFAKQSWHRFNIIKFEVPVDNTQNAFDIVLVIRHLPELKIKELPVNVTMYMPSGEIRSAEHIIKFTDSNGEPQSKCLGDLCDLSFTIREGFIFPETGTVRIEIENKWPRIELPGILEIGLLVKSHK
jgi:gliding motility-associated lipoprotein GldH